MSHSQLVESDVNAIRDYLASFDLFTGNEAEGQSYLNLALQRFLITLSLVPPAQATGMRLLELGGNPYFLTLLIKKFRSYDITLANYFGAAGPTSGRGKQVIKSDRYDETHEFEYDHFNGEIDEFPYQDRTFDVVLNCEILEHLTLDPTAYLCECQRVLKPGGALLLTTPNVLAFQNLWRLGSNRNMYDLYSGYGVYGRHNREYTPRELIDLVEGCGFALEQIKIADIYHSRGATHWLKRVRQHWRDNLFLVARSKGRPIYYYPNWLYRSMGSLRHIRRSEIVMGENDRVQIGEGWHPLERLPYAARWTSGRAVAYLRAPTSPDRFTLEVNPLRSTPEEVILTVDLAGSSSSHPLRPNEWRELVLPAPQNLTGELEIVLSVSPTFNPKEAGLSQDNRQLGVLVKRLGFTTSGGVNEGEERGSLESRIAETQSAAFYGADYFDGPGLKKAVAKSGYTGYSAADPAIAAAVRIVTGYFKPRTALDVGCAKGFLVDSLRRLKIDAWGIDFSPYAISAAPAAVHKYVAVGDCANIDKPANSFDLVICNETLEHLTHENALRAVAELYRVTSDKVWITTPSLGVNDFGPPDGWPQGKIQQAALPRYLSNRDFPDPALTEDLQLDDHSRPIHGHLIAASYRWWTATFTRQGFIRRGDVELRMNRTEQLLSEGAWNSYVFEKPAWNRGYTEESPRAEPRTVLLEPADAQAARGGDIVALPPQSRGLLGMVLVGDLAPGPYSALFELSVEDVPQNSWAEIVRLEIRSHNDQWIHAMSVLRARDRCGETRVVVPFTCSAGEDVIVKIYYEGQGRLRLCRSISIQAGLGEASGTQ